MFSDWEGWKLEIICTGKDTSSEESGEEESADDKQNEAIVGEEQVTDQVQSVLQILQCFVHFLNLNFCRGMHWVQNLRLKGGDGGTQPALAEREREEQNPVARKIN